MYRSITQPHQSRFGDSIPRSWTTGVDERLVAAACEHGQLVEAVHATDGITLEQAELQVTAFEMLFKDDTQ